MICLLVGDNIVKTVLIPHKLSDIEKTKERGLRLSLEDWSA